MGQKKRCVFYLILVTGIVTIGIYIVRPLHPRVGSRVVHGWSRNSIATVDDIREYFFANVAKKPLQMFSGTNGISIRTISADTDISSRAGTKNGDANPESIPHVAIAGAKEEKDSKSCPALPPGLVGKLPVHFNMTKSEMNLTISEKIRIERGGRFSPPDCTPVHKTAIIIPYRNRSDHLQMLLAHLHTVLPRQKIAYRIYLIEPAPSIVFNRGLLANIGFKMARDTDDANYTCYVIHDVDKLMVDDRNIYKCRNLPTHLLTRLDSATKLPYSTFFGGVEAFTQEQYTKINGFSNLYFGWGGEDDDLGIRVRESGQFIVRPDKEIGAFVSFPHLKDKGNIGDETHRGILFKSIRSRMLKDGLSSLQYKLLGFQEEDLYTRVYVSYNETQIKQNFSQFFSPPVPATVSPQLKHRANAVSAQLIMRRRFERYNRTRANTSSLLPPRLQEQTTQFL